MRAITLKPGVKGSARLDEVAEPAAAEGAILVRALALGVCGTDREIIAAEYGEAPPGADRLILGHESLGMVEEAPPGPLKRGDHVVGIVRRPDPVPCPACAAGEWDMCRNGLYTERGIKARHGFGSERFRLEPEFAVKVDAALGLLAVLMEPASIVAKAWDHVDRIGRRAPFQPRRVLVTGVGPIGLIAALMGAQRGLDVHVFDRNTEGRKPALIRALNGTLHATLDDLDRIKPDVVMECTGAAPVVGAVLGRTAPGGIVCLLSVTASRMMDIDIGLLNRSMVLGNDVVFGSVNANRSHYEAAARALEQADKGWLDGLITRHVPLARWSEALDRRDGDIKVVIEFGR
jgi:glucose 1-dehydrogenase